MEIHTNIDESLTNVFMLKNTFMTIALYLAPALYFGKNSVTELAFKLKILYRLTVFNYLNFRMKTYSGTELIKNKTESNYIYSMLDRKLFLRSNY